MIWLRTLAALFIFSACIKEPPPSSPLGPLTSPTEIQNEQSKSLSQLDPYQIIAGEAVHGIDTIEIISSQRPVKSIAKEWIYEVTEIAHHPNRRVISTLKTVNDRIWDSSFDYEIKDVFKIPEHTADPLGLSHWIAETNLPQIESPLFTESELQTLAQKKAESNEDNVTGIQFYNLRNQQVSATPPEKVQARPNCAGLKECKIQADQITYDVVFQYESGKTQTHNVEWLISREVPFFAGILKQCATTLVPIEGARVLVKQCSEVIDFNKPTL